MMRGPGSAEEMTQAEALTRAAQLWPDHGALTVDPLPGFPGEWLVESDGRPHLLDARGHAACHRSCIAREAQLALEAIGPAPPPRERGKLM